MNHTKAIKYIKSQFKNIVDIKINYYEQYIRNSLNKLITNQYALKHPALCEYSIIDSLQELNRQLSAENILKKVFHTYSAWAITTLMKIYTNTIISIYYRSGKKNKQQI